MACRGINLFIQVHGADFRRVGAARPARHDDGRQQHAQFPQDPDRDQIDDEHLGAEAGELLRAHVRDDDADQEGDQRDDRNRGDAGFIDVPGDRDRSQAPW
ncbi:MAG: hypothetical protein WDM77_00970 [Steroidobacteraceae bacterium]